MFQQEAFGQSEFQLKIKGLVSVEHRGKPEGNTDGLCMTSLMQVEGLDAVPPPKSELYQWVSLTQLALQDVIIARFQDNGCVPLIDIWHEVDSRGRGVCRYDEWYTVKLI